MGWFSPVKGSYPSLAQVDKTLPVSESAEKIQRGTIVALAQDDTGKSRDGVWKIAEATDKLVYVALQDYSDPTAGFAGSAFDPAGGVPAITAIDLAQDGEYETSVFDADKVYTVGQPLYAVKGLLTNAPGDAVDPKVIGYVTRPFDKDVPASFRWVNNAIAVPDQSKVSTPTDPRLAIRTGAKLGVLRFKTAV